MRSAIFVLLLGVIGVTKAQDAETAGAEISSNQKVLTYDDDKGTLTLTYSSELGGDKPYQYPVLKGQWKLVGKEGGGEWDTTQNLRICMEIGEQTNYKTFRWKYKWQQNLDRGSFFRPIAMEKTMGDKNKQKYGEFCQKSYEDRNIDLSGENQIQLQDSSISASTKEATIDFTLPFDVPSDSSLFIEPEKKYYIWMNYVIAKEKTDSRTKAVGNSKSDLQDFPIQPYPEIVEKSGSVRLISGILSSFAAAFLISC